MAITILPKTTSGFGEQLGAGLGTGLSQALSGLAQLKLQDMQRRQMMPALKSLGLPEQLAFLPPKTLDAFLRQSFQSPAEQATFGGLENILSSLSPETQLIPETQQIPDRFIKSMVKPEFTTEEVPKEKIIPPIEEEIIKPVEKRERIITPKIKTKLSPGAKAEQEEERLNKLLEVKPDLTPIQRTQLRKQIDTRKEKYFKEQDKIDKKTEKYYSNIRDLSKGANEVNMRLDKMLSLVNRGQLTGVIPGTFLEALSQGITSLGINLDLFGVTSADTQEFKKLQTDMLKDIRSWFGGRITNQEIKMFMDRVPKLNMSAEGKRRVINDLKILNEGHLVRNRIMEEILKENDGYRPHNLQDLVEERAKPELDMIADKFKEINTSMQELVKRAQRRKSPISMLLKEAYIEPIFGESVPQVITPTEFEKTEEFRKLAKK